MEVETKQTKFRVIEKASKQVKGTYSTRKRARTAVDKFDNAYGCYAHTIVEVQL